MDQQPVPFDELARSDPVLDQVLEAPRTVTVRSRVEQLPEAKDRWMLDVIHAHFAHDPSRFEYLAADLWVKSEPRVNAASVDVTRPSRDGGRDAVGDLLLGPGKDAIRQQFALEAKCYAPDNAVGVRMVSRLISRLKHREFGVFVTTSYIADQAYREVREDGHPIVFLTGRDVVDVLKKMGYGRRRPLEEFLETTYPVEQGGPVTRPPHADVQHPDEHLAVQYSEQAPLATSAGAEV